MWQCMNFKEDEQTWFILIREILLLLVPVPGHLWLFASVGDLPLFQDKALWNCWGHGHPWSAAAWSHEDEREQSWGEGGCQVELKELYNRMEIYHHFCLSFISGCLTVLPAVHNIFFVCVYFSQFGTTHLLPHMFSCSLLLSEFLIRGPVTVNKKVPGFSVRNVISCILPMKPSFFSLANWSLISAAGSYSALISQRSCDQKWM